MKTNSILDKIRQNYIDEYLENERKVDYTDLSKENLKDMFTVLYKDLPSTEINAYPFASDYVSKDGITYSVEEFDKLDNETKMNCELRFYYLPYTHELYVGTTGSGKTTGCVEPQLRAISTQKNKPNLFISDPKGELFNRNAKHLHQKGYRTYVLNFKELTRSDHWNPLLELYDIKMEIKDIKPKIKILSGRVDRKLELMAPIEAFNNKEYIKYDNKAFPSTSAVDNYIQFRIDMLEAKIDSKLNQFANMMIKVQSNNDKSWELGAQDLLKGIILAMLEDAVSPGTLFTRDMMNFRNIQQYYLALKLPIVDSDNPVTLYSHYLMKNKSSKVFALLSTALGNAPNTMRSYCGVFDGAIKDWFQGHIYSLTTGNTIDIDNEDKSPYAIFLITRDYEKSDFLIAGLFIDWIYSKTIEKYERDHNTRTFHFILDEFGNIPEISDFENKISTSRSRNVWFHIFVQSYKQIDFIYGSDRSVIIRDNCNSQIFLGSQNRETKEIFANQCGKRSIPTLESNINTQNNDVTEAPLIPISDLNNIKPGQMYIYRLGSPVIMSQFMRSYVCANQGAFQFFNEADGIMTCTPIIIDPFSSNKYTYNRLQEREKQILSILDDFPF